jgi:hypothetical protein
MKDEQRQVRQQPKKERVYNFNATPSSNDNASAKLSQDDQKALQEFMRQSTPA